MSHMMNKKPGMEIVIGLSKPKRPELPSRMFGDKHPETEAETETETSMDQAAEDARAARAELRLDRIERLLEKVAESMGIEDEMAEGKEAESEEYED
jgi:hypothetical protein